MKAKSGFGLREICGQYVIVAEGLENLDFSNIVSMNETAATVWKAVQGREFTVEDMAKILTDEFQLDENTPLPMEQALTDAEKLANDWVESGIVAR